VYPHLVWPPLAIPGRSAGEEVVEALTLLRRCYMPAAGLGRSVDVWVSENGYATNGAGNEATQDSKLLSTVEEVHRYSGTLGVSDYRWFNLRDNDSSGTDLFSAVGLLRDDYSEKPAFATFRSLIDRFGTDRPAGAACRGRDAVLVGTGGKDVIRGGDGPDVIAARGGADRVFGGGGRDVICAGSGRDKVRGGRGRDRLDGGAGRDRLFGGPGRDRCSGGRGDVRRSC
jgi:Ca2+-binding RTX toxin-like protein